MVFMQLPIVISVHNILIFLEYLYSNALSPKVFKNYLSSISSATTFYHLDPGPLADPAISRFIRNITINSTFSPTPRGIFTIEMLYQISVACDIILDWLLFRAIFLTSYFAFLRMSYIAPHSIKKFNSSWHFLRQDVIFGHPGAHIIIKWTKTLQDNKSHHIVQIPQLSNIYLCPVRALSAPPDPSLLQLLFSLFSLIYTIRSLIPRLDLHLKNFNVQKFSLQRLQLSCIYTFWGHFYI